MATRLTWPRGLLFFYLGLDIVVLEQRGHCSLNASLFTKARTFSDGIVNFLGAHGADSFRNIVTGTRVVVPVATTTCHVA